MTAEPRDSKLKNFDKTNMNHREIITRATEEQQVKERKKRGTRLQRMVYTRLIANESQVKTSLYLSCIFAGLFAPFGVLLRDQLDFRIMFAASVLFALLALFIRIKLYE
jgi:hypothetical protein